MPNETLQKINQAIKDKLAEKKQEKDKEETLGWFSVLADSLGDRIVDAVSQLKIETPTVNVSVPDVNVPEVKVPEAKVTVEIPEIKVPTPQVTVNVPEIKFPEFPSFPAYPAFPKIELPTINVPEPKVTVNVPKIEMPEEMQVKGWVSLMGVDLGHPLPVQLRDASGKPISFDKSGSIVGGGKSDFLTIKGYGQSAFAELLNPDGRVRVELPNGASSLTDTELRASHLDVNQLSGANWSVYLTGASGTVGVVTINPDGNAVSGLTDTELRASSVPVYQVSGSAWSTETSGIARTSNPTAVSNGSSVPASFDDLGRQLIRPVQVRDLVFTARASVSNGTETTLFAGTASAFNDLIYVMASTTSVYGTGGFATIDIRSVRAGGILASIQVPNSSQGTAILSFTPPLPQDEVGSSWTIDMNDITGTTVNVSALFSREI